MSDVQGATKSLEQIRALFPALERNMRDTDFGPQQDPSGFIHHRTVLPLSLPRASGPCLPFPKRSGSSRPPPGRRCATC